MTMFYVYGIVDALGFCSAVPGGHEQAEVRAFPEGELAASVSETRRWPIYPSVENVWRHEQVLGALMERHAVLPMRFGTVCDRDRLACVLQRRQQPLLQNLRRVRGMVEIALRIPADTAAKSGALREEPPARDIKRPGTAHLRSRLEARRGAAIDGAHARALMQEIRDRLEYLAVEVLWDVADQPTLPIKASFLVTRDGVGDFVAGAEALASRHPDLVVGCTGPWAPYSFVGESPVAGGEL